MGENDALAAVRFSKPLQQAGSRTLLLKSVRNAQGRRWTDMIRVILNNTPMHHKVADPPRAGLMKLAAQTFEHYTLLYL